MLDDQNNKGHCNSLRLTLSMTILRALSKGSRGLQTFQSFQHCQWSPKRSLWTLLSFPLFYFQSESEHIKEYKNINGVESRNEKSTETSSSNFGELISKHEILSSGGSHGSIPTLVKSGSSSSITKSGQRKVVAPRFISPLNGKIVDLGADVVLEAIIEGKYLILWCRT